MLPSSIIQSNETLNPAEPITSSFLWLSLGVLFFFCCSFPQQPSNIATHHLLKPLARGETLLNLQKQSIGINDHEELKSRYRDEQHKPLH